MSAALDEAKSAFEEASRQFTEVVTKARQQVEESAQAKLAKLVAALTAVDEVQRQAEAAGHRFVILGSDTVEAVRKAEGFGGHDVKEYFEAVRLVARDLAAWSVAP